MQSKNYSRKEVKEICFGKGCRLLSKEAFFTRLVLLKLLCLICGKSFDKNIKNLQQSKWGTCRSAVLVEKKEKVAKILLQKI